MLMSGSTKLTLGITNDRSGTPNSKFVSYFLIQHKSQLGNMHVSKITVFHGDTWSKNPCLLFEVV